MHSSENLFGSLTLLCWVVFFIVWIVSAFSAKRYVRRGSWGIAVRALVILCIIAIYQSPPIRQLFFNERLSLSPAIQWLGVVLCACGVAFAIWARMHLGRNWGMPMSLKQDPDLVTSGPYQYVRHPIYSGMLLAMVGTTLVTLWWIAPLILFFVYFTYAAKTEEKIMLGQFGEKYADYMKRSKMLVPFVF